MGRSAPTLGAPLIRIAVLGGGNGISTVLEGLARHVRDGELLEVTAVVTTADDGGSSGRLRRERGDIPWGDLRRCLLALSSPVPQPFHHLFAHRYGGGGDLAGHALGNLILSALAEQFRDPLRAVQSVGRMLGCVGRVLPVTAVALELEAKTADGKKLSGESRIGRAPCAIRRVSLKPRAARACDGVEMAIRRADLVVLGPGSLFTSLLPVLLVKDVLHALRDGGGPRILVANLMTQPGETTGMSLEDHLEALDRHVGTGLVTDVLASTSGLGPRRVAAYRARGAEPLARGATWRRPERLLQARMTTRLGKVRHDPTRLATELLGLVGRPARRGESLARGEAALLTG